MLTTFLSLVSLCVSSPDIARDVTNSSKAGLAWGGGDADSMEQFTATGKVSWYYTWSPKTYIWQAPDSLEYVPMLWGSNQIDEFTSTINDTLDAGNIHMVLGMNEPQEDGQSNLSPKEGADMWREYINPLHYYYPGVELGSPAPSGAPSGKTWLLDFLDECDGCTVDFIACHWYDINATQFIEYMEDFHDTFNRSIAVTEWSCQNFNNDNQCTEEEVVEFLNTTQSWMDGTEWIKMYAYFGSLTDMQGVNEANRLIRSDGDITELGEQYIGAEDPGAGSGSDNDGTTHSAISRWLPLFGVVVFFQFVSAFVGLV
ncbi:glycosyl hydrolase catalytic core-domain-containing protein [Mucidula mucida]|nr:glycosyl hydrolase catalytic core-domain-containing protein [Mucidula mucida]